VVVYKTKCLSSYYVGTAGKVTSENVKRYIEEQEHNSFTL